MSARGFGSVLWAGAVAGAALSFYLVSLRVASERAQLEDVESEIAMTQRDIRLLQTELGTRGRLAQLERWNVNFIRLSAPTADQLVDSGFQLATLVKPEHAAPMDAPVVLASAPVETEQKPKLTGDADEVAPSSEVVVPVAPRPKAPADMVHMASYSAPTKTVPSVSVVKTPEKPLTAAAKPLKSGEKSASAPATKAIKTATADPLLPLPGAKAKGKAAPTATPVPAKSRKPKDSVKD